MKQALDLPAVLREPTVREHFAPVARSTLWKWIKEGRFPQPIRIGAKAVAWELTALQQWLEGRREQPETGGPE